MFVNIVFFPPIKPGKDKAFREWFAWSNQEFSKYKGFIRRRLLKSVKDDSYAAIVEHESNETFMEMQHGSTHDEAHKRVMPLFDGNPTPHFYEVVMG
jgi:heme-degrading monooxygenase HmoA